MGVGIRQQGIGTSLGRPLSDYRMPFPSEKAKAFDGVILFPLFSMGIQDIRYQVLFLFKGRINHCDVCRSRRMRALAKSYSIRWSI